MSETAWVLHEGLAEDRYSSEPGPARPAERGLQDPKLKPFGASLQTGTRSPVLRAWADLAPVGAAETWLKDLLSEIMESFTTTSYKIATFPSLGQPCQPKGSSGIPCGND